MGRRSHNAHAFREALATIIKELGESFVVTRADQELATVRGSHDQKGRKVEFLPGVDIQEGDILTSVASKRRYFVRAVGDSVTDDELISIHVTYETEDARQRRLTAPPPTPTYQIGAVYNSIVGSQGQATIINAGALDDQLRSLLDELRAVAGTAPPEHADEVTRAVRRAETAIAEASDPQGDKEMARVSLEGLKKAAGNLAQVLPTILPVAQRIAEQLQPYL